MASHNQSGCSHLFITPKVFMIKLLCPISHTVWGPLNNLADLNKAIQKSGQPFGVDWSGPACDFRKDWPCDKTFYQMLGVQAHNGVDLPCSTGTEVFSPTDGTVSEISNDTASGLGVVVFDPIQKVKSVLWHFLTNYKKVGDVVKCGDLIGLSNNTGYSKGPHLHWGLKLTDEKGNSLDKENGYLGAIDPLSVDIFFDKSGIIDNMTKEQVKLLYVLAFYREPDVGELAYWTEKKLEDFLKTAINDRSKFLAKELA